MWLDMKKRKRRNDRYDEECQINVEEISKAQIKMLDRRTRMNTENYKNKQRETNKMCRAKNRANDRCWKEWRKEIKEMYQENCTQ